MMDTDKGTWVKRSSKRNGYRCTLQVGSVLANYTAAEKAQIMKEYFGAISQFWPDAWGDLGKFNLCRPIGFTCSRSWCKHLHDARFPLARD
jgi:hypothetical protein